MFALNFYSEFYEEVLKNGRKTVSIRLGDKTDKYRSGMIVWVTVGPRFARRQKLFTAILDRVEVKTIDQLSPREIQKENPEFRTNEDVVHLLRRIYSDDISVEDTVTVIHFSPISEYSALP
ncbi:MAG TPA: ASCH domain-containing protein [Chthonomonadaceae bacterium]|nr:ASCH domain-containing protein [Chthonomonadaceae bacterium]